VDLACRFGGEEFVVLMPDTDYRQAQAVAERVRAAVAERPFAIEVKTPLSVTCSVGVALNEHDTDTPESILKRADIALYRAKREGRNRGLIRVNLTYLLRSEASVEAPKNLAITAANEAGRTACFTKLPTVHLRSAATPESVGRLVRRLLRGLFGTHSGPATLSAQLHQNKKPRSRAGLCVSGGRRAILLDLGFLELDVLAHDRIVLLEAQLLGLGARILLRHVVEAGVGRRDELDLD
jgi:hypothetical protein